MVELKKLFYQIESFDTHLNVHMPSFNKNNKILPVYVGENA